MEYQRLWTISEVAKILRISPSTIRTLISNKGIGFIDARTNLHVGNRKVRFTQKHIDDFLKQREVPVLSEEDIVWDALWDRGYSSQAAMETLMANVLVELDRGEPLADAIAYAERCYDLQPRSRWCPQCQSGDVTGISNLGFCDACGTELEAT